MTGSGPEPGLAGRGSGAREHLSLAGDVRGEVLAELCARAVAVRDAHWGHVVTYSRKVFLPLTNLCRDTCGYCTFARNPGSPGAGYMEPEDVLRVARAGADLGCKEALFSLGERPELRWPEARVALRRLGYESTLDYLAAMCRLVVEETPLVPHANPGTLSSRELQSLAPYCGSMGLMLETVSERMMAAGMPHYRCPDKHPARRLATLEAAGQAGIPFTTGLLIGIGETWEERLETLDAIAAIHARWGTVQEVIVQNFRAKPGILMERHPEPDLDDMCRTLAAARLLLPPEISLQAPPNLAPDPLRYLDAGINDWGGISPLTIDFINPECAWPRIAVLADACAKAGFTLRERLTVYPRHLEEASRRASPIVRMRLEAHRDADGMCCIQAAR